MKTTLIFFLINFAALGIGGYLMGEGPKSEWYENLNKAPWTPPGWVFGFAWTTIMICFSFFMSSAFQLIENKTTLLILFIIQLVLNISWNPIFFNYHNAIFGLIIISLLTVLTAVLFVYTFENLKTKALLIIPYVLWLIIATSLNGYVYFKN